MSNKCLKCDNPAPMSWYCQEHYLEKEFNYAMYDITKNKEFANSHKDWTLNRLLAYIEYKQR